MEETTQREKILKKVRNALMQKSAKESLANIDFESNVFPVSSDSPDLVFAQNFTETGGKFIFCEDNAVLIDNLDFLINENNWQGKLICEEPILQQLLEVAAINFIPQYNADAEVAFISCECLITRTGSIMVSSRQGSSKQTLLTPKVFVIVAFVNQIEADLKSALNMVKTKYSGNFPNMLSVITNSIHQKENADNDDKEIYVLLIDNEEE